MTANEWLGLIKQAQDFPQGMEKLIVKYGEMLIAEHESKVKKLTIPDVMQQSELLNCPNCCSGDVHFVVNEDKYICMECKDEWEI